jgi:ketosteroid isomerase-like protein
MGPCPKKTPIKKIIKNLFHDNERFPSMEAEKIIPEFFNFLNLRDLERMRALLQEDARLDFPKPQPLLGLDRILKFLLLFRQYPELTFTLHRTIVLENRGAVHWTNQGKNRREEPYENEGMTLLKFERGKISYISDFFNDTGKFLGSQGRAPTPPHHP